MGDRVTCVQMRAFRGVRGELALELPQGASMVLLGENATGKSTVADALEWYFTGTIGFLRPEGRAGALRHLAARSEDATSVAVKTTGSLGGDRAVDAVPAAAVREAGRETFLLRGRTLTAFVECTKGEKWRALAELLGFEEVDQFRLDLQKARNEVRNTSQAAHQELGTAERALSPTVGAASGTRILAAISELCGKASVPAPISVEEALGPGWSDSLAGAAPDPRAVQIAGLASELAAWSPPTPDAQVHERWNTMLKVHTSTDRARLGLFNAADSLLAESGAARACPLCGQAIDEEVLRSQIRGVVHELRASAEEFQLSSDGLWGSAELMDRCAAQMADYRRRAAELGIEVPAPPASPADLLRASVKEHQTSQGHIAADFAAAVNGWLARSRAAVNGSVAPPPSPREGILVELGVLVSQARRWGERATAAALALRALELAETIFQAYSARQQAYFGEVLDRISGRVAEIYARLHPGEALADVGIEPWGSKGVELAVSFHGSRQRPPHGVLSESHLNSLAIALFLAMADTFNEKLDFLVLDDVVNSFDIEHRGELAALLAAEFAHRQLIVLTHDQLFFERLTRLAPSWKKVEITSWDFDDGPRMTMYQSAKMLEKAQSSLDGGDRTGAAMMGRRALEEVLQEICEGLAAPLPFRRGAKNDRREIGEVLTGVRHVLKELSKPTHLEARSLLDEIGADVATALNPEAHASQGHPSSPEVQAALQRITQLSTRWTCPAPTCRTRMWHHGTSPLWRCRCGLSTFPPPPASAAPAANSAVG